MRRRGRRARTTTTPTAGSACGSGLRFYRSSNAAARSSAAREEGGGGITGARWEWQHVGHIEARRAAAAAPPPRCARARFRETLRGLSKLDTCTEGGILYVVAERRDSSAQLHVHSARDGGSLRCLALALAHFAAAAAARVAINAFARIFSSIAAIVGSPRGSSTKRSWSSGIESIRSASVRMRSILLP